MAVPDTVKLLTQTKTRGLEYDYPHAHYKDLVGLLKHITADLTRVSAEYTTTEHPPLPHADGKQEHGLL